jgi:nucleoside phosphorylase
MARRVALCTAFTPELESLRGALRRTYIGATVHAFAVGIGIVDAAIGVTTTLAREGPFDALVFVGTCGAFEEGARGRVVFPASARLVQPCALRGEAELIEHTEVFADAALVAELSSAPADGPVATVLGITVGEERARSLAQTGAAFEHLEAYAVLRAASLAAVPAACVLGVSNRVGSTGREEWRAHRQEVEHRAALAVDGWLASLPPPVPRPAV